MGQVFDTVVGGDRTPQDEQIDENEKKYDQTIIDRGPIGCVYRCQHKSKPNMIVLKKSYCLNVLDEARSGKKDELEKKVQNILKAAERLKQLRHPHVVPYYWVTRQVERDSEYLYAFLEHCSGGSLKSFITQMKKQSRPLDEKRVCRYLGQMASGLKFLHDNKIIHANIRPSNILFTADREAAKITDFGEGHLLMTGVTLKKGQYGPISYMAPEMAVDESYTVAVDVWSLGIIVHEMATLSLPGRLGPGNTIILDKDFMPLNSNFSEDLIALVWCMLTTTVAERATCETILQYSLIEQTSLQ